jgi:hypothetical protein
MGYFLDLSYDRLVIYAFATKQVVVDSTDSVHRIDSTEGPTASHDSEIGRRYEYVVGRVDEHEFAVFHSKAIKT